MAVKAVLFDVGGVLLTLGEIPYRNEIARRLGLPNLPKIYEEKLPALQRGEESEEALWALIAGHPVASDAFDDAWLEHFRPVNPILALAEELRRLSLKTGILSNTQPSHARLMRQWVLPAHLIRS